MVIGRYLGRRMNLVAQQQSSQASSSSLEEEKKEPILVDSNILEFCTLDPKTGEKKEMTLGEKELLFMDAVASYYRGEPILSNNEFDILQEELAWQGSKMVNIQILTFTETKLKDVRF